MPLNLSNLSKDKVSRIKEILVKLYPLVLDLNLTLDNLNNVYQFLPEMVQGCLKPGVLQVCDSTLVILDETGMEAGTLQERGIQEKVILGLINLSNLRNVLQNAILPFILGQESAMEMPIDLKFLVLSEGKTLLSVDCVVPVIPSQSEEKVVIEDSVDDFDELRAYLNVASNSSYHVPEDIAKRIVSEFSSVSKGRKLVGQDLIRRLEIAR